jgi:PAS domain S-box-containing protein
MRMEEPGGADVELLKSQVASLTQLLDVQEQAVIQQSGRLENALRDLQQEREALRESERHLRAILDTALDAIINIDSEGAIIDWNPQAEKILGWSRDEAVGQPLHTLAIPSSHRELHRQGFEARKLGCEPLLNKRVERTAVHRDGHEFPVELSMSKVGSGEHAIVSIFLRDITERKQAEEQLARAHDEAVQASRLKSEFLATMSHEVRTPMNGVIGMADLLLETDLSVEQTEYAQTIQGSAEALLTILNDILDFSKIEAGRMVLEAIPFDLLRVVEETGNLLAPRAAEKGLELVIRYAPDAPWRLMGDPGRIRQVLTNLAGNAIKFTETGHVLINVECEQQTAATAGMRISVEDTGIGIAGDKLENVFEKFTQADASTTRKYGGTGLGLAISKRLAELMGGSVGVASRLGEGSTFWLSVSLDRDTQIPVPPAPEVKLAGLRALIVDDNAVNRRVLQEQLARLGISATSVAGGEEALGAMRQAYEAGAPFHLGLLDHLMPAMDGQTLGRVIKADLALRPTVLLLLTSSGDQGEAASWLGAGFAAHLVKPVRQSQLEGSLAGACGHLAADLAGLSATIGPATAPEALARPEGGNYRARVLVVEDNLVNQRVTARMLETRGCLVEIAANGRQALEMVEANACDLIFMDCQMPEMDGFEATAEIRRRQGYRRHTPIIALTANAMQGDRERCLAAGMDDYIAKPMKPSDIARALERWLAPVR